MRNGEFEKTKQNIEKGLHHMINNGTTRDQLVRYTVNRIVGANSTFTSRQIDILFRQIL